MPDTDSTPASFPYATHLDIRYKPLELVEIKPLVDACTDAWYNQTLCKVNDSVVRLGVMQGEYHWHKHDHDDELFFVLEGHFIIDLPDQSVDLQARQGFVVPKGVVHRTREHHSDGRCRTTGCRGRPCSAGPPLNRGVRPHNERHGESSTPNQKAACTDGGSA